MSNTDNNLRGQPPIYTFYVKEEPKCIEEDVSNPGRIHHFNDPATNNSHNLIPSDTIMTEENTSHEMMAETIVPETIVPEIISPDSSIILEPRKRGRPKKKPLSILTPMEISQNHDVRTSGDTLESLSEHLYAGFLGRTRRTTRQLLEDPSNKEWSDESGAEDDEDFSGTGRPFGSVKNRGRGRGRSRARSAGSTRGTGRGRGKKETEDTSINTSNEQVNDLEEMKTDSFAETETSSEFNIKIIPNVKCGKCLEEFCKKEWSKHNLFRHNDTGWLEGETPANYDLDEKALKKVLFTAIKKKKGQLACEKCGIVKRSVEGFLSHVRFCGKSLAERQELMVQCPKCKSSVKPTSMYTHERNCQKEKVRKKVVYLNESVETPENNTTQIKTKRKAAEKAVSRISEVTSKIVNSTERITTHTIRHFIQKPQLERKIGARLRSSFVKELEIKGQADCRQAGCQFFGTTLETICEHYSRCGFEIEENFVCKVCSFHSLIQKEIMDHVLENHGTEEGSDDFADPDHQTKSEESSEASDFEKETPRTKTVSKLRFLPEQTSEKLRAYRAEFLELELLQNPKINVPYSPAYRWTLEFELLRYQLILFQDLLPNEFVLLSQEASETYLPELHQSMAVKKEISNVSDIHGSESTQSQWKYWQRFEGLVERGVPTFFVGGPVWAIAWLPIPIPMYSYQPSQYLAVSTHSKMESEYAVGQAYSGENLIQIWNLGNLEYANGTFSIPELSYAVAHNGGTVWCMEWCPSGCYQDQRIVTLENVPDKMKRMGLLAAACSDGFVHVYSLPFPEELQVPMTENDQLLVYKANPVQLLVVNISLTEKEKQTWQCTKLSWTKESGHNILAAGFSNGYIALWNLTTQSPLLTKKQGNTTIINAIRHFYAHNHSVSMIAMIPCGEKRFLASAGMDRCYKIWDLEQSNCIECVTTRGLAVDGAWMNNWPCSVLSYDDALGLSHTNSQLIPLREHSYKYFPILSTNSPTYAISVSDFANAVAQGNLAGEIVTIFPHQVLYKDIENYLNKKRWLCSYVEVTDFQTSESSAEDHDQKEKKKYHYKPTTYNECCKRFGISFSDEFTIFRNCKAKVIKEKIMPSDQLETVSIEQYPFASVNRISWNPNAWSHLFFAAGYQNGFVRILNFNSLTDVDQIKDSLPRFINKVFEKQSKMNKNNGTSQCQENRRDLEEDMR